MVRASKYNIVSVIRYSSDEFILSDSILYIYGIPAYNPICKMKSEEMDFTISMLKWNQSEPGGQEETFMKTFQYAGMPKVYFGEGALDTALSAEFPDTGDHVMLAYGGGSIKRNGIYEKVLGLLEKAGKEVTEFSGIMANPTYAKVREGAELARTNQIDFILAVGGGSVIDCCKIICAQAKMDKDIWAAEFRDHQYPTEFIPLGAVTTVSGTGSEMNSGAVITNEETKQKNGMSGALSRFAVLDPSYTLTVPMRQAVSGAFDTLSHCMETYFGKP